MNQRKNCIILLLTLIFSLGVYSQDAGNITFDNYSIFENQDSDKYYIGWLDKRAMVTTLFFNYNFDLEDTFRKRTPGYSFDFSDVFLYVDTRIAKEIQFYRNQYFSVGIAGAVTAAIFEKEETINNVNFYTYDFAGEFAAYIDLYLQDLLNVPMKIRVYPMYHHSTHFVDGYKAPFAQMGASYEFFGLSTHYFLDLNNHLLTPYAGLETTYRHAGNGAPAFKVHMGNDYRYKFLNEYDMSFIAGFNVAYIHDYLDLEKLIENQNHYAATIATGIEFHNFVIALKYKYERGRGATTYFDYQNTLGIEFSVFY